MRKLEDFYQIVRWQSIVQVIERVDGKALVEPLIKACVGVVIKDPYAGKGFTEDLSELTKHSDLLGHELGKRAAALLQGAAIESYGKGGIAGTEGSQEHVVACITTVFGDAFREEVGGGQAWISSTTKLGGPGVTLDIPLAYKDEVYVRSHYDAISFSVPEGPLSDEMIICVAVASAGRPHSRVGGLSVAEFKSKK